MRWFISTKNTHIKHHFNFTSKSRNLPNNSNQNSVECQSLHIQQFLAVGMEVVKCVCVLILRTTRDHRNSFIKWCPGVKNERGRVNQNFLQRFHLIIQIQLLTLHWSTKPFKGCKSKKVEITFIASHLQFSEVWMKHKKMTQFWAKIVVFCAQCNNVAFTFYYSTFFFWSFLG